MNALFYFDCFGHKELKNIAYNGLWDPYAVTVGWMDGMGSYLLDCYDYKSTCGAKNGGHIKILLCKKS